MKHGTLTGYQHHRCRCDRCRAAHAAWSREYRQINRDKINAGRRAAYAANRAAYIAAVRSYWSSLPIAERRRRSNRKAMRRRLKNGDVVRAAGRRWYHRNRDKARRAHLGWYAANKEYTRRYNRERGFKRRSTSLGLVRAQRRRSYHAMKALRAAKSALDNLITKENKR